LIHIRILTRHIKFLLNRKNSSIDRKDLESVAKKVGIRNHNSIIDKVVEGVSTFENRMKQYDLNKNTIKLIVKELGVNSVRIKNK